MASKTEKHENELLRDILHAIHHLKKESERIMSVLSDLQNAVAALQTANANETSAVLSAIADINSLPASDAALVPLTAAITAVALSTQANADKLNAAVGASKPATSPTLASIAPVAIVLATAPGLATVALTGITSTAPTPTITVLAVSSDAGAVISPPAVVYTTPAPTGSVTFTPVAVGTATVTVTVNDTVASVTQTFVVTVS
jgi:hypothetical protein